MKVATEMSGKVITLASVSEPQPPHMCTMCIRAGICSNYALCDDAMDIDDVAVQYYVLFAYLVVVY